MWKQQIKVKKYSNDFKTISETLLIEKLLSININNKETILTNCSPQFLEELSLGICLAKGFIHKIIDIKTLKKIDDTITIFTQEKIKKIKTSANAKEFRPKEIMSLMYSFQENASLYKETGIAESAALSINKEISIFSEDLDRLNAVYKCLGKALKENYLLENYTLIISGKLCSELLSICAKLHINCIISRSGITQKAYMIAKENNIQILIFLFVIFF